MATDSPQPLYSIGAASKLTGVPVGTLRTWHERYGVVIPERSAGGHRLYSRADVEQLRFVADQVASGLSPADAHRVLASRLAGGPPGQQSARGDSMPGGSILILLAERDPHAAELTEYFLRDEGYEVVRVSTAEEALTTAAQSAVDVAVVDLLISGARGLGLCEGLHDRATPVVAISTFDSADEALDAGASAFLQKPVAPLQLVSTVRDLLGRSAWAGRDQPARMTAPEMASKS